MCGLVRVHGLKTATRSCRHNALHSAKRRDEGAVMRAVFGMVGLLVVLAIVAVLSKKNLSATKDAVSRPPVVDGVQVPQIDTSKNVREQSQQIQDQVRKQLEQTMQQPRAVDSVE